MLAGLVALVVLQKPSAQTDLQAVIDRYKSLKNVTFTIVRHRDPSDEKEVSADRVNWNDRKHFQIDFLPWGASISLTSPTLLCDDGIVDTLTAQGIIRTEKLDPGPDHIGIWEMRGGYLLCWLMGGKTWDMLTKADDLHQVDYAYGQKTKWRDFDVKEIVVTRTEAGIKEPVSVFLDPAVHSLVGYEDVEGGQPIWTEIRDVRETEKS